MLTQTQQSTYFTPFYEDNSILMQFIIEEFIQSHQLIFLIKTLNQDRLTSKETLSSLTQVLGQLIGSPKERPSLSHWIKGSLTTFKEYCEQLSRNASHQNKEYANLQMAAHQAWLMAMHNFELLNSLYTNPYIPHLESTLFLLPIKRSFYNLQIRFNQVKRSIPRILNDYCNDENVIYCLLRKKEALGDIFGYDFLHKRFKGTKKRSDLIELVVDRYQIRGFENLLPSIRHLLESELTEEHSDEAH